MSATTSNLGQLTAEQVRTVLIDPLTDTSRFLSSGVNIIPTSGPLRIPRAPSFDLSATAWTAEGGQIPTQDGTAGELSLLPSGMKSIKVISKFTAELARQGVVSVEAALRSSLVRSVSEKLDAQLLSASTGVAMA